MSNPKKNVERHLRAELIKLQTRTGYSNKYIASQIGATEGTVRWFKIERHGLVLDKMVKLANFLERSKKTAA